jgi:hypothetical protein
MSKLHIDNLNKVLPGVNDRHAGGSSLAENLATTERACGTLGIEFHPFLCEAVRALYVPDGEEAPKCDHIPAAEREASEVIGASPPDVLVGPLSFEGTSGETFDAPPVVGALPEAEEEDA